MPVPMSADEIVEDLTERIHGGEYPPGSQMPTYHTLQKLYGVSYTTIYTVIKILKDRGTLVGKQGRGTFVPEE